MQERTLSVLTLYPVGNLQGSCHCYDLVSGGFRSVTQYTILPMPASVVNHLNQLATSNGRRPVNRRAMVFWDKNLISDDEELAALESSGAEPELPDVALEPPSIFVDDLDHRGDATVLPQIAEPSPEPDSAFVGDGSASHRGEDTHRDDLQTTPSQGSPLRTNFAGTPVKEITDQSHLTQEDDALGAINPTPIVDDQVPGSLRASPEKTVKGKKSKPVRFEPVLSDRQRLQAHKSQWRRENPGVLMKNYPGPPVLHLTQSMRRPSVLMLSHSDLSHIPQKRARAMFGRLAVEKEVEELVQLLNRGTFLPRHAKDLSKDQLRSVLRSTMFAKVKHLPSGEVEKLKQRLVAGGDMQDKSLYDDLSSPTVSTAAVFTMAAVAAREKRKLRCFDIGGAFLHAKMEAQVVIRLKPELAELLAALKPEYA